MASSSKLQIGQQAIARVDKSIVLPGGESDLSSLGGKFQVEHFRGGVRIGSYSFKNGITNEGKNILLDVMFHGTTLYSPWYLGLIDLVGYSALAAGDTYDNIDQAGNGWDEFADYKIVADTTIRPEWTEGSASAQSITNASVVTFIMTGSGDVKGVFLVGGTDAATKSDHAPGTPANKLWATALFAADVPVVLDDQLKVTYTVSA